MSAETAQGRVDVDSVAGTYTVTRDGSTTEPRPVPAEWEAWVALLVARAEGAADDAAVRDQVQAGMDRLLEAAAAADSDVPVAQARETQAAAAATAATARAAQVRASTPAVSLSYVSAMRDEIAVLHDRDALLAQGLADVSGWRAKADRGVSLAYTSMVGLARVLLRRL